ncbi:DUF5683 domain-containing protein [Flagellimonas sp. DF-77]|uniref:DUF5683 domain-containing protein n=1 Tax=Flagellimonas algarum TaxID=3230298 RepID=UPI003396CA83
MNNGFRLGLCLFFIGVLGMAQETEVQEENTQKADSVQTDFKKKGVTFEEVTYEKVAINPLAPSKAAFYSAIMPGLGQIYNKRYWKAPIVWGAIGIGIYNYSTNNTRYNQFRDAFKRRLAGFTDDQFYDSDNDGFGPDFSDSSLQDAQESTQRNRDLWLVVTIGFYALNIIDANVDAHLKQYNVNEQLGIDFKPFMNLNEVTGEPYFGMALAVTF